MQKINFAFLAVLPVFTLTLAFCASSAPKGEIKAQNTLTMTIGSSVNLSEKITSLNMEDTPIVWRTDAADIVSVTADGVATAVNFTEQGSGMGKAVITASNASGEREAFTIITTMAGTVNIMDLPPMKDQFGDYFMIGAIFHNGSSSHQGGFPSDVPSGAAVITNQRITRHFNVVTHENELKPGSISNSRNSTTGVISYNWVTADRMVDAAIASGLKVVGHTLLWHSQIPEWQVRMGDQPKDVALAAMKQFISDVAGRYAGKIYSWDVLNEGFPNSVSEGTTGWRNIMRSENPWYKSIGADFVYEGFLAAREADPNAILYYNDFNLDEPGKAMAVRNMVRDVNSRYASEYPNAGRLLIEGIGMQGHYNTGVSAENIRRSINLFRPLGVKISISELDVLSQNWNSFSGSVVPSFQSRLQAANLYNAYFKVFLDNADIIERVTFWGVFDQQSWRSRGLPLLFEGHPETKAKPAYYRVIQALEGR